MARRKSYLSEHTVEFSLVPQFRSVLSRTFESSLVFYFWASREGYTLCTSVPAEQMRLIAVYPRRPKLDRNGEKQFMKVNVELFRSAEAFRQRGVPVFAGFPLVRSLCDFAADAKFTWFALTGQEQNDIEIEMELGPSRASTLESLHAVTEAEVCRVVKTEARPMLLREAIESINQVRRREGEESRDSWHFGAGYKPVYFLVW